MAKLEVSCKVSCQNCGWNTGATLFTSKAKALEAVLSFIKICSKRHSCPGLSGELLVSWQPLKAIEH